MNLFNYLMAKKKYNSSVRNDLFAYLLGKSQEQLLPKEYKQIEYLKSTGTQYINTDYSYKYNSSFELVLKFDNPKPQAEYPNSKFIFIESRDLSISKRAISINFGGNYDQLQEFYVWSGNSTVVNRNNVGNRILSKNLLTIRETTFSYGDYTREIPLNTNTVEKPMLLFAGHMVSSPDIVSPFSAYDMYVYDFKLYEGDNLVRHYIPCVRKSDNKPGLYDLIGRQFYTNSGTGEFLYG